MFYFCWGLVTSVQIEQQKHTKMTTLFQHIQPNILCTEKAWRFIESLPLKAPPGTSGSWKMRKTANFIKGMKKEISKWGKRMEKFSILYFWVARIPLPCSGKCIGMRFLIRNINILLLDQPALQANASLLKLIIASGWRRNTARAFKSREHKGVPERTRVLIRGSSSIDDDGTWAAFAHLRATASRFHGKASRQCAFGAPSTPAAPPAIR